MAEIPELKPGEAIVLPVSVPATKEHAVRYKQIGGGGTDTAVGMNYFGHRKRGKLSARLAVPLRSAYRRSVLTEWIYFVTMDGQRGKLSEKTDEIIWYSTDPQRARNTA